MTTIPVKLPTSRKRGWSGRERIPHTRASSDEIIVKSIFGSVLYCLVILRTTPHWSVKMTSCYFKLLTWEQQIKITYAAWVRTTNKFQIIIMGHGDLLSYFILSCFTFKPNNNYFLLYLMSRVDPCPPISATVSWKPCKQFTPVHRWGL